MHTPQQLICPKCQAAMGSYERSGIVIDQCSQCRGIFLDRGELERFIDLAASEMQPQQVQQPQWQGPPPDRSWRQQQVQQRPWGDARHDWDHDSDSHRGHGHRGSGGGSYRGKPYRKRKSILGELLDF